VLVAARERGFGGGNRIEAEELVRSEQSPLFAELSRLAEASLTAPEVVGFRSAVTALTGTRETLMGQIESLSRALQPTGLIGRLLRQDQRRLQLRAELVEGIRSCRVALASCAVDLNTHLQDYRNLHDLYQQVGRVFEQRIRIWDMVSKRPEIGPEAVLRSQQYVASLAQSRVVIAGLISAAEADLITAANHLQFVQSDLTVALTGLVAQGAPASLLMAPSHVTGRRLPTERELQVQRRTEDRIATLLAVASTPQQMLTMIRDLVLDLEPGSINTNQGMRLIGAIRPGLNWGRENGFLKLGEIINVSLKKNWTVGGFEHMDSEALFFLIHKLAPEPNPLERKRLIQMADRIWRKSRNWSGRKPDYLADLEAIWRLAKREWEQRSVVQPE
jgi:hypothetical protein